MGASVFLSHTHSDKPFVRKLAADLRDRGAIVWIDDGEIEIGDSLIEKIREGIDEYEYVAVVLSKESVKSSWVKREVDVAMNQEIEGKRVKVLPVLLQQCELPGFLKGKRYADFTTHTKYHGGLQELLRKLGLSEIPNGFDEGSNRFVDLAIDRLKGRTSIADILHKNIISGEWQAVARLELAYHEYSRLGEHKSLKVINDLGNEQGSEPFLQRSFALLKALCFISRDDIDSAQRSIQEAPNLEQLSQLQQAFLSLNEGIVCLALGEPQETDRIWKTAAYTEEKAVLQDSPYPLYSITKSFDRSLIKALLGVEPISNIIEKLPHSLYRGMGHQSAVSARVIHKCDAITRNIGRFGEEVGWSHLPEMKTMKQRMRDYANTLRSNSGTLFPRQNYK